MTHKDKVFSGSIPEIYDRFMVPMLFEPYAQDMAFRVTRTGAKTILETAAGTPLRNEILERDDTLLEKVTNAVAEAIEKRFGSGSVEGKMQAHVFSAVKD